MQNQTLRIVVALLLTVAVMLYFYSSREKDYYSKSAEPAVATILTEISKKWNEEGLLIYLAPEARQVISDEQLSQLMILYRKFGQFRTIQELNFSRTVSVFSIMGEKRINYSGIANFEKETVSLNITFVERNGYFLIYNLSLTKVG